MKNIIIIDPTDTISNFYDILNVYSSVDNYNKLLYMTDKKIYDVKTGNVLAIQEKDITPKTYLRYIKLHIIDKRERINVILHNVPLIDIHKYYYYMTFLEYNPVLIIDNKDIADDDLILDQYDNLVIQEGLLTTNQFMLNEILNTQPLDFNINKNVVKNFSIGEQGAFNYGKHRYGWNYVRNAIKAIEKSGLFLDIFMEKTFLWEADKGNVYSDEWVGIFHNPIKMPKYFTDIYKVDDIFSSYSFIKSMETCKGLITLSNYNKDLLQEKLPNTKIFSLKHPLPNTLSTFTMNDFLVDPKILHIGYWLRDYRTFYKLNVKKSRKLLLDKTKKEPWLIGQIKEQKKQQCHDVTDEEFSNVKTIDYLEDHDYDIYMKSSVVMVDLLETSANNLVVECIKYNTPLLINKHPAVVEYLGEDYPFYYKSVEEASLKCDDFQLINETHQYLHRMNKDDLNIVYFLKELTKIHNALNKKFVNFYIGDQCKHDYGEHRSGWSYVVNKINDRIKPTHDAIYLDTFIERTFVWGKNAKTNVHLHDWAGVIHNPRNIPKWFQSDQSLVMLLKERNFVKSLMKCKMLITLSDYNTNFLENHPIIKKFNIPIKTLYHPTETPDVKFNYNKFLANTDKKVLQIGWWLRKLHAIYLLPRVEGYKKVAVGLKDFTPQDIFKKEKQYVLSNNIIQIDESSVELMDRVSNEEYDELLSQNIVFINLYDSSANNLVIECIARRTPILINKVGGVVDYLGEDYPFYYKTYEEATRKLQNTELIKETTEYLKSRRIQDKICFDKFYDGLCELF